MIINHKKPSLNHSIKAYSDHPLPLRPSILTYSFLSRSSSTLHTWYRYYPDSRYPFLQSITPQVTYNIQPSPEIDGYIRFLVLLQVLLLLQRAIILKNTIPLLLHPNPSPSTFPAILRSYSNTISTLVSRYQCHSISPAPVLLRVLAFITT